MRICAPLFFFHPFAFGIPFPFLFYSLFFAMVPHSSLLCHSCFLFQCAFLLFFNSARYAILCPFFFAVWFPFLSFPFFFSFPPPFMVLLLWSSNMICFSSSPQCLSSRDDVCDCGYGFSACNWSLLECGHVRDGPWSIPWSLALPVSHCLTEAESM